MLEGVCSQSEQRSSERLHRLALLGTGWEAVVMRP